MAAELKRCSKCGVEKPPGDFYRDRGRKDKLTVWCRVCVLARVKQYEKDNPQRSQRYYEANRERSKAQVKRQRCSSRRFVQEAKAGPCSDCGQHFPPCAMDFDHVRGVKEFNLCTGANRGYSKARLAAEIAKCDLVCANCHRIRTQWRSSEAT